MKSQLRETTLTKSAPVVAGLSAFPLSLGAIQHLCFAPLRLTCSRLFAPLTGISAVATAGLVATSVYIGIRKFQGYELDVSLSEQAWIVAPTTVALTCGTFKLLGGRFKNVLPSHLLHPGAFGKKALPASLKYANQTQKVHIQQLGRKYGCHSCGAKFGGLKTSYGKVFQKMKLKEKIGIIVGGRFIADHQPPLAVYEAAFRGNKRAKYSSPAFYPQCQKCSSQQRLYLGAVSRGRAEPFSPVVTHASSLRLYHLWLPWPWIVTELFQMLHS
ncbi:uncharacterized protein LOC144880275 isoform X2 [Branchiostoma floridae x Branchiostoma japonicum]